MRALLFLGVVATLLAACETAPVTGRSQMMLVGESEERQMGLQAYRDVLSKEQLSEDAQANALVGSVGRRIAAAAERPPGDLWRAPRFRWKFKTIDKNELNAFCLPGGKVVVYTGILPITRTEAGLAVVIGHEVAHALARHGAERMSDQMVAQVGATAAAVALSATVTGRSRTYLPAMMAALGAGGPSGHILPMSPPEASACARCRWRATIRARPSRCGSACAQPTPVRARPSGSAPIPPTPRASPTSATGCPRP